MQSLQAYKYKFLSYELGLLTMKAALSTRKARWPIYAAHCKEFQRNKIKASFRKVLDQIALRAMQGALPEAEHLQLIRDVADQLSAEHGAQLHQGRFRHGTAQKLVNMQMKYLWTAGLIDEPLHCPIDGIIRNEAKLSYEWTSSDCQDEYVRAISDLRKVAGPLSLSLWELQNFKRANQN